MVIMCKKTFCSEVEMSTVSQTGLDPIKTLVLCHNIIQYIYGIFIANGKKIGKVDPARMELAHPGSAVINKLDMHDITRHHTHK